MNGSGVSYVKGGKVFYAKTAQNFYNLSKGLWRPKSKSNRKRGSVNMGASPYA